MLGYVVHSRNPDPTDSDRQRAAHRLRNYRHDDDGGLTYLGAEACAVESLAIELGLTADDDGTVVVPCTAWGDYAGSTYTRSNARSLLRDYPDLFGEATDWAGSTWLTLNTDQVIDQELYDTLVSLAREYPLELEDWDSFGRDDFRDCLRGHLYVDAGEPIYDHDDELTPSDTELDDYVWDHHEAIEWEAETATSGYFRGLQELAQQYGAEIIAEWSQRVECEGQTALA